MKQFVLQTEHQGIPANTVFNGPTLLPGTANTYAYYAEGEKPEDKFCFFESYVNEHPDLFKEVANG